LLAIAVAIGWHAVAARRHLGARGGSDGAGGDRVAARRLGSCA
jgi:hypothetical protein